MVFNLLLATHAILHLEQLNNNTNSLYVSLACMISCKDQLQVLDSVLNYKFDLFDACGYQPMLIVWHRIQLVDLAIKYKFNDNNPYNSGFDDKIDNDDDIRKAQ